MSRKPQGGEEDPELVKEIEQARLNLGQYTRKTSETYENQRPAREEEQKQKLIELLLSVMRVVGGQFWIG